MAHVHMKEERLNLLDEENTKDDNFTPPTTQNRTNFIFKAYVIASMTLIWTAYTILIKYTRSTVSPENMYSSTTVVLFSECLKFVIAVIMFYKDCGFKRRKFIEGFFLYFWNAPIELLKMSVPSIAYAIQNNLDFVALSNLDAGVYQVTTQLKVVSTAFFMMLFLKRRFSPTRWLSIFLLMVGIACVQLNNVNNLSKTSGSENYLIGLTAVLVTCVTAGFAGVYFEMMLKGSNNSAPFWVRNMQMYTSGIVSASIGCLVTDDFKRISTHGFTYGYTGQVVAVIALLSIGGIYISLVMRYLDNLYKSMASAVSIILVVFVSVLVFPNVFLGLYFCIGTMTVVLAVLLYNSVSE